MTINLPDSYSKSFDLQDVTDLVQIYRFLDSILQDIKRDRPAFAEKTMEGNLPFLKKIFKSSRQFNDIFLNIIKYSDPPNKYEQIIHFAMILEKLKIPSTFAKICRAAALLHQKEKSFKDYLSNIPLEKFDSLLKEYYSKELDLFLSPLRSSLIKASPLQSPKLTDLPKKV